MGGVSVFNSSDKSMWSWHQTEPYQRDDPVSQDQLNDPAIAPVVKGIYLVNAYMKQILGLAVKVAKSQATVIQGEAAPERKSWQKSSMTTAPGADGPFIKG